MTKTNHLGFILTIKDEVEIGVSDTKYVYEMFVLVFFYALKRCVISCFEHPRIYDDKNIFVEFPS